MSGTNISYSVRIHFSTELRSDVPTVEELKEILKNCIERRYPDTSGCISASVSMTCSVWDDMEVDG